MLTLQDGLELQSDSWEGLAAPEKGMLSAGGEPSSPRHEPLEDLQGQVRGPVELGVSSAGGREGSPERVPGVAQRGGTSGSWGGRSHSW